MIGALIAGFLLFVAATLPVGAATADRLFYLNNGVVLQGCVYKPAGQGPFPAVVFIQNAIKPLPAQGALDPMPELGQFFTGNGYVLFLPGRHNLRSADEKKPEGDSQATAVERDRDIVSGYAQQADTIFAGIETLKAQNYVNTHEIFVSGFGSGGTISLLLSEKELDVRGYVVFSPAASLWKGSPLLQSTLKRAVHNAKAPVYLIQPQNDFGLEPTEVLGKELQAKGAPNQSKIFPAYGRNAVEANGFALRAADVWGADVLTFFKTVAK